MQSTKTQQATAQLARFDLPPIEVLREAVIAGEAERASCTSLDAPTIPGTMSWGRIVRILREILLPSGWKAKNVNNLPLVVEPVKKIAIAAMTGTDGVGKIDRTPTTKQCKGPVFQGLVKTNRGQFNLFGEDRHYAPVPKASELTTWVLLVFTEYKPRNENEGDHVTFYELSLPAETDGQGRTTKWAERIIFPPLNLDEFPVAAEVDDEEEYDVPVQRIK